MLGLGLPLKQHVQSLLLRFKQVPTTVPLDTFELGIAAKIVLANTYGIPLSTRSGAREIHHGTDRPMKSNFNTRAPRMWDKCGRADRPVFCKQGDFGNIQMS